MVWRLLLEHNLKIFCEYVHAMIFSLIFLPVFSSEKLKPEIRGSSRIWHSIVFYACNIIYLNFYIMLLPYVYNPPMWYISLYYITAHRLCISYLPVIFVTHAHTRTVYTHTTLVIYHLSFLPTLRNYCQKTCLFFI